MATEKEAAKTLLSLRSALQAKLNALEVALNALSALDSDADDAGRIGPIGPADVERLLRPLPAAYTGLVRASTAPVRSERKSTGALRDVILRHFSHDGTPMSTSSIIGHVKAEGVMGNPSTLQNRVIEVLNKPPFKRISRGRYIMIPGDDEFVPPSRALVRTRGGDKLKRDKPTAPIITKMLLKIVPEDGSLVQWSGILNALRAMDPPGKADSLSARANQILRKSGLFESPSKGNWRRKEK
jgi:hypothetical protein